VFTAVVDDGRNKAGSVPGRNSRHGCHPLQGDRCNADGHEYRTCDSFRLDVATGYEGRILCADGASMDYG
jgi:hypothetical protein